ncbi:hypothetical protein [Methylophaga sp. OBS4]|uniref:hypothetical protein n=1 Tax=Methylophaga sp. OBS4 TaxID=2991935 RepID=UPI00225667C7|nr:hypothetical protein [Methylophaga sp. OBS4]MCX4187830.1 hypothetical protein [Methylophaga sp. OBS4]
MTYKLDKKFLRRTKLKIIAIGLAFLTVGIMLTYSMVIENDWKFLFGIFLIYVGFKKVKELKYWEVNNSKISLEINHEVVSVFDFNEARSLKVNRITKAVLQPIHGKIKSIVIYSSGGGITKLEGFETMDKIASQLKGVLGESNVKTAKMFHR